MCVCLECECERVCYWLFKQLGKSMPSKHNSYRVLIFHPFFQAEAKLVGFFKGILTVCSWQNSSNKTIVLSQRKFHLLFILEMRKETGHIYVWYQFNSYLYLLRYFGLLVPLLLAHLLVLSAEVQLHCLQTWKNFSANTKRGGEQGGWTAGSQLSSFHLFCLVASLAKVLYTPRNDNQ